MNQNGKSTRTKSNYNKFTHDDIVNDEKAIEFFLSNIDINGEDDCWPYVGYVRKHDTIRFKRTLSNGKKTEIHLPLKGMLYIAVMEELYPSRSTKFLENLCGDTLCMNPTHWDETSALTIDSEKMYHDYMNRRTTSTKLSKLYGISVGSVFYWMNKYAKENGFPRAINANRTPL